MLLNGSKVHWHLKVWSNCMPIPEIISFDKEFLLRELQFRKFAYGSITGFEVGIDDPDHILFSDYSSIRIYPCTAEECKIVKGERNEKVEET